MAPSEFKGAVALRRSRSPKFVWQIVWQLFKNALDVLNINDFYFSVSPWDAITMIPRPASGASDSNPPQK